MELLKCKCCGWNWYPRVPKVKQCPRCKNANWNKGKKQKKETVKNGK